MARQRGRASWEEHELLIDAIEAGDEARAAEIMRDHTEHTRSSYLDQRTSQPDGADESEAPAARRRRPRSLLSAS